MHIPEIVAISTMDHKQAALLFDRLVPMSHALDVPEEIKHPSPSFTVERARVEMRKIMKEATGRGIQVNVDDKEVIMRCVAEIDNRFTAETHSALLSRGVIAVPLFRSNGLLDDYLKTGSDSAIQFSLANVPMVDTSNVEWEQILDVRHDPDFRKKAARFRSFIDDSYKRKDALHIVDDLSNRIDAFELSCKRHGLNMVLSTLSQVLNSKSLIGSLGVATAGILTGNPSLTAGAFAGGAVMEIGKAMLNISEKHIEFRHKQNDNPLSFLVELKQRFQ